MNSATSTSTTTSTTSRSSSASTKKRRRQDSLLQVVSNKYNDNNNTENVEDDNNINNIKSFESTFVNNNYNNSYYYTYHHQNALQVDIDILIKLLHRHSLSHGRTKYYQRLSMVLQLIRNGPKTMTTTKTTIIITTELWKQKYSILSWFDTYQELQKSIIEFDNMRNKQQLELAKEKKRNKLLSKVFISDDHNSTKDTCTQRNEVGTCSKEQRQQEQEQTLQLQNNILQFLNVLQCSIPECINRIEYATQSILIELVRGFFVPFHTIAIGCLGRIRTLVLSFSLYILNSITHSGSNYNFDTKSIQQSFLKILVSNNDTQKDSKFIIKVTESIQMIQQYIEGVTTTTTTTGVATNAYEQQQQQNNRWDPLGIEISRSDRTSITLQSLGLSNTHLKKKQKTTTTTTKSRGKNQKKSKDTISMVQKNNQIKSMDQTIDINSHSNDENDDDYDEIVPMKSYSTITQNDVLFDDNDEMDDSDSNYDYDDSSHRHHYDDKNIIDDSSDDNDVGQSVAEIKQQQHRLSTFMDDDDNNEDQDNNNNNNNNKNLVGDQLEQKLGKYHELDRNAIILQSIQQQQRCQEEKEQRKVQKKLKLKLKEQQKRIKNNNHYSSKNQKEEIQNKEVVELYGDDSDYHINAPDNANTTTVNAFNANLVKDKKNGTSSKTTFTNTALITTPPLDNIMEENAEKRSTKSIKDTTKKQKIKNKTKKSKNGKHINILDDIFE